jgi:hypothetical protein
MFDAAKETYGDLLRRHLQAARENDTALQGSIYAAVTVFEELYPEETAAWTAQFSSNR